MRCFFLVSHSEGRVATNGKRCEERSIEVRTAPNHARVSDEVDKEKNKVKGQCPHTHTRRLTGTDIHTAGTRALIDTGGEKRC